MNKHSSIYSSLLGRMEDFMRRKNGKFSRRHYSITVNMYAGTVSNYEGVYILYRATNHSHRTESTSGKWRIGTVNCPGSFTRDNMRAGFNKKINKSPSIKLLQWQREICFQNISIFFILCNKETSHHWLNFPTFLLILHSELTSVFLYKTL